MSKTVSEFEDIVRIFLGIVGEPQLSDKNFHVLRGIDLNNTIKKHRITEPNEVQPKAQV